MSASMSRSVASSSLRPSGATIVMPLSCNGLCEALMTTRACAGSARSLPLAALNSLVDAELRRVCGDEFDAARGARRKREAWRGRAVGACLDDDAHVFGAERFDD